MSNDFPAAPADVALASLSYQAALPRVTLQPGAALEFSGAVTTLAYSAPILGFSFAFDTPGSAGSFDQSSAEYALAQAITTVCGVLASMAGVSDVTSLQLQVRVTRTWGWVSPSTGVTFTTQDLMPYYVAVSDGDTATGGEAESKS